MTQTPCGHDNPRGAEICETCGVRITWACADCGAEVAPDARFCMQCGRALIDRTAAISVAGERRQMTIMFCDLVGSTELGAQVDPEEYSEIVDAYYQACGAAIQREGGYITRYIGDGMLSYFGYPIATEDSTNASVRAGLAAQSAIAALNEQAEKLGRAAPSGPCWVAHRLGRRQ